MNVLIADKFEQAGIDAMTSLGCSVTIEPALGPDTLAKALDESGAEVLIVRSTKVPASVIETAPEDLKLIIRAGAGYDNIDTAAASARGIAVCNCPGMNAIAVAELAMGHLLSCDRRLPDQTADQRAGKWRKKEYAKAKGIKGMTLGIVGVGHIGEAVIQRAKAFEMEVMAWSRSMNNGKAAALAVINGGSDRAGLLKMLANCDTVSVHVAANGDTNGMCNAEFFNAMKPGAYFINTSRGTIVDENALAAAVKTKGLRCGLDVYQNQSPTPEADWKSPLADLPGVYCSHHVGASTEQAQGAVAEEAVRIIEAFKDSGQIENCVNAATLAKPAQHEPIS